MKRNMRRPCFRALALAWILLAAFEAAAQTDVKLNRSVSKQFGVPADVTVDIDNKYGRVVVKSWEKDSVAIDVEITAFARDARSVQKMIERVEIDFNYLGSFLTAETVLDRGSGTLKELMNSVSDYSKTLISKSKISIDYEVTLPKKASLYLENKFGNVFISDHEGPVKLTLAHGDLRVGELSGHAVVNLSFGKANVKKMGEVELVLKAAQADITEAGNAVVESMTSELRIESTLSARVNSRNDKLNFQKIGWVSGKGMFTDWTLGEVQENLDLDVHYGQVYVNHLGKDFVKTRIHSKYSDLNFYIDPACWISLDVKAEQDKIYIPANWFPMLQNTPVPEKEGYIQLKGQVGRSNSQLGLMELDLTGASVTVYYLESMPLTKN